MLDRLLRWAGLDFDVELGAGDRFDRVAPGLFVGARPQPDGVAALKDAGITHVVSCLADTERGAMAFLEAGFVTRFVPLHDGILEDVTAVIPGFLEVLAEAEGGVLVHCQAGVSRSATLAIAHVMASTGARFFEAYGVVRAGRPQVLPNIGFASQLQRREHEALGRRPAGELASLTRYLREACRVPVEAGVLQEALEHHDFDAVAAIQAVFGGEIPRVVQGVRHR